jgi:hypothetical protein
VDNSKLNAFLIDPLHQKQLGIIMGLLTWHCHLNTHLFKPGLVHQPGYGRYKQALEMASHVLCDCETLATLRFRHLGQPMATLRFRHLGQPMATLRFRHLGQPLATLRFRHLGQRFLKPGDFSGISISRILHSVQGARLLNV